MTHEQIVWWRAVLVVGIVVAIAVAGAFVLLRRGGSSGEKVRFYSRTYFYLIGTEDNGPLENVVISLPEPNVDNKLWNPWTTYVPNGAFWTLYAVVDNQLVIEVDQGVVKQLVGPRTSTIEFTEIGYGPSLFGPKFGVGIENLYPGELFEVRQWFEIPADEASQLTLRDAGPEEYPTYALVYSTPGKKINGSFFAGLYKGNWSDNTLLSLQKVEEFGLMRENVQSAGWWELAPI